MKKTFLITLIVVILFIIYAFIIKSKDDKMTEVVSSTTCTMEAKICPDGSSVGRTGPTCEFAPCPGE